MTEEEYVVERLENQINWYSRKSSFNKNRFTFFRLLSISFAVLIPFFTGLIDSENEDCLKILVAGLGASVAIIEGILGLCKFQENWIQYRSTTESLKHQKFLFNTKTDPYNGENAFELLVKTSEWLISKEHSNWLNQQSDKNKEPVTSTESKKKGDLSDEAKVD